MTPPRRSGGDPPLKREGWEATSNVTATSSSLRIGSGCATRRLRGVAAHRTAEVLALVGLGLNNSEIADRLYLSQSTIKSHVSSVLAKTGSRDRVQAALLARRAGLELT